MINEQLKENLTKELNKRGFAAKWVDYILEQIREWQEEWKIEEDEHRIIECKRTDGEYVIFEFRKDANDDDFYFYDVRD